MRKIDKAAIGEPLKKLLDESHPLCEDIGIIDDRGQLSGVVITKEAYGFFLKKVEEEEDKRDLQLLESFDREEELKDSVSLEDVLHDMSSSLYV